MPKIEFDGKIGLLSLTSFLLSLITIANQFSNQLKGPQVTLHTPNSIVFRVMQFDDRKFLSIDSTMTYTNTGATGYNDIIQKETVKFELNGKIKVFKAWTYFIDSDDSSGKTKYNGAEAAGPKVIPGQGAITHWTQFIAMNESCSTPNCDRSPNSVELRPDLFSKIDSKIYFTFASHQIIKNSPQEAKCYVDGNYFKEVVYPDLEKQRFATAECFID